MPEIEKLSTTEFAAKIKAKYPEYKDVDDNILTEKMIAKYPEYKDKVNYTSQTTVEKKNPVQSANALPIGGENVTVSSTETVTPSTVSVSESVQKPVPTPLASTRMPQAPTSDPNLIARRQEQQVAEQQRVVNTVEPIQPFLAKTQQSQLPSQIPVKNTMELTNPYQRGSEPLFDESGIYISSSDGERDMFYKSLNPESKKEVDTTLKSIYTDLYANNPNKSSVTKEDVLASVTTRLGKPTNEQERRTYNAVLEQILGNVSVDDNRFEKKRNEYLNTERYERAGKVLENDFGKDFEEPLFELNQLLGFNEEIKGVNRISNKKDGLNQGKEITLPDNLIKFLADNGSFIKEGKAGSMEHGGKNQGKDENGNYILTNGQSVTFDEIKDLYNRGLVSFSNPFNNPIANAYTNEKIGDYTKQKANNSIKSEISQMAGGDFDRLPANKKVESFIKLNEKVDSELEKTSEFYTPAEKLIKKGYDKLISINNQIKDVDAQIAQLNESRGSISREELASKLEVLNAKKEFLQESLNNTSETVSKYKESVLGYETQLFDPLTGKQINGQSQTPESSKWNEQIQQKTSKYLEGYQGSLQEAKVKEYYRFKQLQEAVLSQERFKEYHNDVKAGKVPYDFFNSDDRLFLEYQDAAAELKAIGRAEVLNLDVKDLPRSKSDAFMEGLMGGIGADRYYKSNIEVAQDFVNSAKENGVEVSKEQEKRIVATTGENIMGAIGSSIPVMVELAVSTAAMNAIGVTGAISSGFNLLRGMKLAKDSATFAKTLNVLEKAVQSGVNFQAGGQDFATGVGEGVGQSISDGLGDMGYVMNLFGKSKLGKVLNNSLSYTAKRAMGATGETLSEYLGEFSSELSQNGFEDALKTTIGDDPFEKFITTMAVSAVFSIGMSLGEITTAEKKEFDTKVREQFIKEYDAYVNKGKNPSEEATKAYEEAKSDLLAENESSFMKENNFKDGVLTPTVASKTAPIGGETTTETEPTKASINPIIENIEGATTAYTDSEGNFFSKGEVISMIEKGDEKVNGILFTNPSPEVVAALEKAKEVAPEMGTAETVTEMGTTESVTETGTTETVVNEVTEATEVENVEQEKKKTFLEKVKGLFSKKEVETEAEKPYIETTLERYKESLKNVKEGDVLDKEFFESQIKELEENPKAFLAREKEFFESQIREKEENQNTEDSAEDIAEDIKYYKDKIQKIEKAIESVTETGASETEATPQATQAGETQTNTTQNEVQQTETKSEATPETVQVEEGTETTLPGENQKRREDGSYIKDGVEHKRNEPTKGVAGKEGEVRFTDGTKEKFTYKLIEAEEAQPSHQGGRRNPNHFIPEAQPKNRTDDASKMAEQGFATKPRFESLGVDQDAYAGAPVVNERGEVIQGNNRTAGLKQGYKDGTHSYKENLAENAEQFGLTKEQVQGMKNPILVREVKVDDNKAIELGNYDVKDMETGGKSRIDPVTLSRRIPLNQKQKLTDALFSDETKSLNDAIRSNEGAVIEAIRPFLNQAQRNSLIKDGKLTKEAINDIEALVKEFMFEGADTQLSDSFDNLPKTIQDGIKKSMPYIFAVDFKNNLISDVQTAITILNQFKASGVGSFEAWATQYDGLNGKAYREMYSPLAMAIAGKINDSSKISDIVSIFKEYKEATQGTEANIFNEAIEGSSKKEATEKLFGTSDDKAKSTSVKTKPKEAVKLKEPAKATEKAKPTTNEKATETPKAEVKPEVKSLADKLRSLKVDTKGKAFDATLGIPISLYNSAIDIVVASVEAGMKLSNAIAKAMKYVDSQMDGSNWNKGKFAKDMNVRYSVTLPGGKNVEVERDISEEAAEVINGWYLPIEQKILDSSQDKQPANKWAEQLRSKEDEDLWTGVRAFLESKGTESVTKKELKDFIKENRVEIVEVAKGETEWNEVKKGKWERPIDKTNTSGRKTSGKVVIQLINGKYYGEPSTTKYTRVFNSLEEAQSYYDGVDGFSTDTKFSQYQLEGEKENYKEVLVTLPSKVKEVHTIKELNGKYYVISPSDEAVTSGISERKVAEERAKILDEKLAKNSIFKSSHFDEPNILVHLRMNTRTDAQGNKVLFLEEVQSDWGQKGKKEGFDNKDAQRKELEKRGVTFNANGTVSLKSQDEFYEQGETWELIKKYNDTYTNKAITPAAPFVTDTNAWTKLGLKVALKEAIAQGVDKIAWTTGEQQNGRYDLSKSYRKLSITPQVETDKYGRSEENGNYLIEGIPNKGDMSGGAAMAEIADNVPLEKLADYVGKEIADKVKSGQEEFEGNDLKVGGKGMKGFYGNPTDGSIGIVGGVAEKLFGQKVGTVEINKGRTELNAKDFYNNIWKKDVNPDAPKWEDLTDNEYNAVVFEYEDFKKREKTKDKPSTQHSIDITPEMKAGVETGTPLFGQSNPQTLKKIANKVRGLKVDTKGKAFDATLGIPISVWNTTMDIVATALEAGASISEAIKKGIDNLKSDNVKFDEKTFTDKMNEVLGDETVETTETKPKTEKPASEGGEKKRLLPQSIDISDQVSDEIKQGLSEDARKYIPISNEVTTAEAKAIIKAKGTDKAMSDVLDFDNAMTARTRVEIARQLILEFNKTDPNSAIQIAEEISKYATKLGQGVQALSLWSAVSPEGIVAGVNKKARKVKEASKKRNKATYDGTKKGYKQGTETAAKKATKEAVDSQPPSKKREIKAFGLSESQIDKKLESALDKFKKAGQSSASSSIIGLNNEQIEALVEIGYLYFAKGLRNFKDWASKVSEDTGLEDMAALQSIWDNEKVNNDKTLKELSEVGDLENVVSKSYSEGKSVDELSQTIQDTFGIGKDFADSLSKEIDKSFKKIVGKERKKAIRNQGVPSNKRTRKIAEEISEENNLTDEQIEDAIAKEFGVENFPESKKKELFDMAEKRDALPDGYLKNRATSQMLAFVDSESKIPFKDKFWGLWYASVLSGHETQILNAAANWINLTMEGMVSTIQQAFINRDPMAIPKIMSGFVIGLKQGLNEAGQVLTTGDSPRKMKEKYEIRKGLEKVTFKGGKFNPANAAKYVGRFMSAIDAASNLTGRGMMLQELARETAISEGLKTEAEIVKRVSEILNNSDEVFESATTQAKEEVDAFIDGTTEKISEREKNRLYDIRRDEIIESAIPDEVSIPAKKFGDFVTFNYQTQGVIGIIAESLNGLSSKIPGGAFKFIVPFTGVVANVLNQMIDYTPYGYLRANGLNFGNAVSQAMFDGTYESTSPLQGSTIFSTGLKNTVSDKQVQRQLIKATMGTALMVGAYMLAKAYEDDEDPFFSISSGGPSDPTKKSQLYAQGWKPYSLKIGGTRVSYQYTPMGLALGFVGNWLEGEKYKELDQKDLATKSVFALQSSVKGVMDMSFLTGLSGLMSALSSTNDPEKEANKFLNSISRTATSFIPNTLKQMDKVFHDNTIYETKTLQASILADIPFVKSYVGLKPKLNALGQDIERQGNRFFTNVTDDVVWKFLADKEIFIGGISATRKMPNGEVITTEELYEVVKISGLKSHEKIKEMIPEFKRKGLSNDEIKEKIDKIVDKDREKAIKEVYKKNKSTNN